jgi:hypothetical protein
MVEETEAIRDVNRRKLVYVAGPYQGDIKENIEYAEKVSIKLIKLGFDVITPHKNTAGYEQYVDGIITRSTWLAMDLNILSRCDAIFVMNNSSASEGTAAEIAFVKEHNIPFINVGMEWKKEEGLVSFLKRQKGIVKDPRLRKEKEEDQRRYDTLTAEDDMKLFSI